MTSTNSPIQDRVKTYEDACAIKGIIPLTIENFSALPEDQRKAAFAYHKLITIAEVLNEGWKPDYDNWSQYKHYPWWDLTTPDGEEAGSGFSLVGVGSTGTCSVVGARLSFKSEELVEYAAKQFIDDYRDLIR